MVTEKSPTSQNNFNFTCLGRLFFKMSLPVCDIFVKTFQTYFNCYFHSLQVISDVYAQKIDF